MALGQAIPTQPDVALVDAGLGLSGGVDLATVLPRYAALTRTLLLADPNAPPGPRWSA